MANVIMSGIRISCQPNPQSVSCQPESTASIIFPSPVPRPIQPQPVMKPRRLINQRLARSLFLQAASDWGRPMARPPAGFYAELEKALTLKIQAEAAHPGNRKPHRNHFPG